MATMTPLLPSPPTSAVPSSRIPATPQPPRKTRPVDNDASPPAYVSTTDVPVPSTRPSGPTLNLSKPRPTHATHPLPPLLPLSPVNSRSKQPPNPPNEDAVPRVLGHALATEYVKTPFRPSNKDSGASPSPLSLPQSPRSLSLPQPQLSHSRLPHSTLKTSHPCLRLVLPQCLRLSLTAH